MRGSLVVSITLLLLSGAPALYGADGETSWLGVLWTKGPVSVGNAHVTSGTTVLPGDVITTSEGASAWLRFRSPASTVLLADSQMSVLGGDAAPSIALQRGTLVFEGKLNEAAQFSVPGGLVLVEGDSQSGAECELATAENTSTITVRRGLAEIHGQGPPVILRPGESARVEAGPQGAEPVAGRVNRVIPQGEIQRSGQIKTLPLTYHEIVYWNDLVRTLQVGRAQIMLVDGSTLNVGARSEIKILRHVPDKQQTEIQLTLGSVQANVQKITTPGGKFELQTKSAVIGTIDTSYVASADANSTRVCGVAGTTEVRSSDPSITKRVRLRKNQCTVVVVGMAPTDPVYAPAEVASMMSQTTVQAAAGLSVAATAGIAVGAAAGIGAIVTGVVLANSGTTTPTTP